MFASDNLDKYVFKVVLVDSGDGLGVADPEVNGIGWLLQGDASRRYVTWGIGEDVQIFISEIVIFWPPESGA